MSQGESTDSTIETFTDTFGIRDREATILAEQFDTTEEIATHLEAGNSVTDLDGIGDKTSMQVLLWFDNEHPEKLRTRRENDEGICTQFTTDVGLKEGEAGAEFIWAFICPRCDQKNPCKGDPAKYRNRPFRCTNCNWVAALNGQTLDEFREAEFSDQEPTA